MANDDDQGVSLVEYLQSLHSKILPFPLMSYLNYQILKVSTNVKKLILVLSIGLSTV